MLKEVIEIMDKEQKKTRRTLFQQRMSIKKQIMFKNIEILELKNTITKMKEKKKIHSRVLMADLNWQEERTSKFKNRPAIFNPV